MKLDRETIRREGAIRGHDFEASDTCAKCGITVADLIKVQDIPPCDTFGPGPKIDRAMKRDG